MRGDVVIIKMKSSAVLAKHKELKSSSRQAKVLDA